VTPPGVKHDLQCTGSRAAPDAIAVTCENAGKAYAQPRELSLSTAAGRQVAVKESALYLLPGVKRTYELRSADGPIPGGSLKLALTFDDGSAQGYDLSIGE
jgi:fimbrial chaperone protein